jgi:hypothetical protein
MSGRHGYSEDGGDDNSVYLYRGTVANATRGKRGQKMLRELRDALDAMPTKELVPGVLQTKAGECCALGCLAAAKGKDLTEYELFDPYDLSELNASLAKDFDVAECLVREVEYMNDEGYYGKETPQQRWERMRRWVDKQIKAEKQDTPATPIT